ncbi:MAG: putative glycolipid-binding domain-containing protein [Chryseolinea sp.]
MKGLQTNILWTGIEYYSLENCLVEKSDNGYEINSVIVGFYEKKMYRVDYLIRTTPEWVTKFVDVSCRHEGRVQKIRLEGDGNGKWLRDGVVAKEFLGCIDVDIPLTPFTNTLPVNRLKLYDDDTEKIKVIYIDLLLAEVKAVHQKYTRLSATEYHYENVPNDFEAVIRVDDDGLVVFYPELFSRKGREEGI